jgi:hypothetical protein
MPSEKMRYLKNRPTSPFTYRDIQAEIKNFPRKDIEDLLLNFSSCSTPLGRTMIVMTAISRFKSDGNESVLKKALLYALDLEDHVRYDRAGEYSFIIYPVLEFFQENVKRQLETGTDDNYNYAFKSIKLHH